MYDSIPLQDHSKYKTLL